jgi:DNA-directed RNA polymerase specialized sigma24 family protein
MHDTATASVEAFLVDFFGSDDRDYNTFFQRAKAPVLQIARRRGYGLSEDQIEEVHQEVCLRTLTLPSSAYHSSGATGREYLYGLTLNAIGKVQRSYGVRPTRKATDASLSAPRFSEVSVSIEAAAEISCPRSGPTHIYNSLLAREVLAAATVDLRRCMIAAYVHNLTTHEAAAQVSWSRFKFNRELHALRLLLARSTARYTIYNLARCSRPVRASAS